MFCIFIQQILFFLSGLLAFVPVTTRIENGICINGIVRLNHTFLFSYYYSPHCFTLALMIPLLIMVFCYTRMFLALRESMKMTSTLQNKQDKSSGMHKTRLAQLNIFETCLIMTCIFLICWSTIETALLLYMIDYYPDLSSDHYTIGRFFILLNSGLNPYVYALRYRDFKKQFKILIGIEKKEDQSSVTYMSSINTHE